MAPKHSQCQWTDDDAPHPCTYALLAAQANPKKLLNRREWVDAIIRIAIMRHVMDGDTSDASQALSLLLAPGTFSHLPLDALDDGAAFRTACCYTEPVDTVLRKCVLSVCKT